MTRPLLPAAALALALSLSACGGDDAPPSAQSPAGIATTVPTAPTPTTSAAPTAGAPSASATPSAVTPRPAPSDGDAAPAPAASAPAARSAAPASAAEPRAGAAAAVPATRAGSYTYDSRGTVTAGAAPRSFSGTTTLTADAPVGDAQSLVLEGDQGRTETDTVRRADGRYLSRLLLTTPAFSKEFRFSPAALLVPAPAEVGRTWSFTAKSTDGKTTATAKNRVVRAEDVTVGGKRIATRVVETQLTLRGDITYDGTTTTNYAPQQGLAVKERGTGKGSVSGFAFSTDTTSTLRSVDPR